MTTAKKRVPPLIDSSEQGPSAQEIFEFRGLDSEHTARELANSETSQKIRIRWLAIFGAGLVIAAMLKILACLIDRAFWGPFQIVSPAVGVAMIVAPIVSVTAIIVAILVGAFRKFDEKDLEKVLNGSSGAAQAFGMTK
jgi:ABC-type nickel/cobalt efflux system permease component RcnA